MAGDSPSLPFQHFSRKQGRTRDNSPFPPSLNDRRGQRRDQSDHEGEEYSSGTENIRRRYYSADVDLINLEEKMEAAKRSTSTPLCDGTKGKDMIAAGGPRWMDRVQNMPRDGLLPVGLFDLVCLAASRHANIRSNTVIPFPIGLNRHPVVLVDPYRRRRSPDRSSSDLVVMNDLDEEFHTEEVWVEKFKPSLLSAPHFG
jgi:hypothetical protein